MTQPRSEKEITELLQLDKFAQTHPAPGPEAGLKMEDVIVLEGTTYTKAAVDAALKATTDEAIRDLLSYEGEILAHNNICGHGGAGSQMNIKEIVLHCASKETRERIKAL